MSERRIAAFARNAVVGVGLVALIAVAWVSLARVAEWFDETIRSAVRQALLDTPEMVSAPAETEAAQEGVEEAVQEAVEDAVAETEAAQEDVEEAIQEAVDGAVQDAERYFAEIYGSLRQRSRSFGARGLRSPTPMSAEVADRVIRFNIAVMTRRYRMDSIDSAHRLRDVDIGTQRRLGLFRARLGSSLRATFGGTLEEQAFQEDLGLTTGSTVEDAAGNLARAFDRAWSAD
ncbi:MAG: hypothetical protein OXG35_16910 [Acidobacteria bacterium]|nr:hypothetical protein [Acidobacteriota bacterium]